MFNTKQKKIDTFVWKSTIFLPTWKYVMFTQVVICLDFMTATVQQNVSICKEYIVNMLKSIK